MSMSTFGERLKMARAVAGITSRKELAKLSGIPSSRICKMETDDREPNSEEIIALSKACGMSPEELRDIEVCNGPVYRANVSMYASKCGITKRIDLVQQKKMSCGKCWLCTEAGEFFEPEYGIIGIDSVVDGHLYHVKRCNIWVDPESGVTEQWDWEVVDVAQKFMRCADCGAVTQYPMGSSAFAMCDKCNGVEWDKYAEEAGA